MARNCRHPPKGKSKGNWQSKLWLAKAKEQSNNRRARAKAKDQGQAATFAEELITNQSARRKEEAKV